MTAFRLRLTRASPARGRGTRRGPGRFRRMISTGSLWPALAVLALGIGAGVQLGQMAVGDIDPIHFQGAAARPRAVPVPAPVPPSSYQQAFSWERGEEARAADRFYEDFDYAPPPLEARRAAAEPEWREPETPPSLSPWPPGQISPRAGIERYTDFPVERKQAPETRPADSLPADAGAGE